MAERQATPQPQRQRLPFGTPRRVIGAAFLFAAAGTAVAAGSGASPDPVCGPRRVSLEIPETVHRFNDIPFFGENITQEVAQTVRSVPGPSCDRGELYFRQVAFEESFASLRAGYLDWLETQLTGPRPLTSAYARNHAVEIVDQPGEFRWIDTVRTEPDHQGRLEIHLTEERGRTGPACRQVILRYSYPGASCGTEHP